MTSGTPAALAAGELLIDSTTAQDKHLAVGETVPARFALTGPATLRIGGIYQANALIGSFLVSAAFFTAHYPARPPGGLLLRTDGSIAVNNAVTSAVAPYPNVQVQTEAQFEQAQVSSVNQLLGLIYALLALVSSLKQQGITDTVVPISSLLVFLVIAALLGLVAGSWPARRAAKLDVLAAIAAE